MKHIIASSMLPSRDDSWPLLCPTDRLGARLASSVEKALKLANGWKIIEHFPRPRWDWVDGAWVSRGADNGPADPLYACAAYEDVDILDHEGNVKAILRVRRAAEFDPKKEPCVP